MEESGRLKPDFLKGFLELPNGIPDESAFRWVFGCLNPPELQRWLENRLANVKTWTKGKKEKTRLTDIDGKTIWGSGFHVVSAWTGEHTSKGRLNEDEMETAGEETSKADRGGGGLPGTGTERGIRSVEADEGMRYRRQTLRRSRRYG
jgi:hypothetical protein